VVFLLNITQVATETSCIRSPS